MRHIYTTLFTLFIFFLSCKGPIEKKVNSDEIIKLREYAMYFKPNKINSLNEDSLNKYDIEDIFLKNQKDKKIAIEICEILLLKTYLYHLKKANQSYNLLDFQDKNSKAIIYFILKEKNINTNVEFISSSVIYNILKENKGNSIEVSRLINEIKNEENRILNTN